ncbi:hypothetical protein RB653_004795 [Dictyostelium firmibasis]|uniref:Uncharacterized protein n=1 Tax=Dictyostelium firmibasis TaxID=79012 RepID=A0AAN7YSJ9_9MYCE
MDFNKISNIFYNLINNKIDINNKNNNSNKDNIELTEELINDFKIINIKEVLKINKNLLKEKVKRNQLLDFIITNSEEEKEKEEEEEEGKAEIKIDFGKNYFELIFNNFKDEIIDYEFYKDLFKNYSKYFQSSIIYTANYLTKCDCVVGLKVLIDDLSFSVPNNLYQKSIEYGSINVSNFLVKEFKCKLTNEQQNNIWSILLNKSYKNEKTLNNLTKSIHYLASINTNLPTIPIKFVLDFPIKSKTLDLIIDICFSISYIIGSLKSYEGFYNSNDDDKETPIKLLSPIEIEQIKNKYTTDELSTQVEDLDSNRYSIKLLVKMACYFTSSINCKLNFIFYNLKFENKYNIKDYSEIQLIESSILSCNYGLLSRLYEFHLDHNGNQINNNDSNNSNNNKLCLKILDEYITNDSKQIFRYSLPLSIDLIKQKMFIECSINDYCNKKLDSYRKFPIQHLIKIILLFNNVTLVQYMLDLFIKFKPIIPKIKNKKILSWIQSTKVFDLLFQQKLEPKLIKDFKFKQLLLPRKDMNLIDCNNNQFKNSESKEIIKKELMLNTLLNHFKLNYNNDYKIGLLELKVSPFMFGSSFIFKDENFNDFKSQLIDYEFWKKHLQGKHDYKGKIIKDGPRSIPKHQFIKLLMITPQHQNYTCIDSMENLDWIIKNSPNDLTNQRCITNQLLLFQHSYHIGTLKETKIEFEKYHGNYFLNFILASGLIEKITKNADIESLNLIIDLLNQVKSPKPVKSPQITISLSVTNLENGENIFYHENEQNNELKQIVKDIKTQIFKSIGSSNRADILEYLITCHSNLFTPISVYQSLYQTCFDNSFTSNWCNIEVCEYILNTLKYNCFSLSHPSKIERIFNKSKNHNCPPFNYMQEKYNSKINFKHV